MRRDTTTRKLELFALHCHLQANKPADYIDFFRRISRARGKTRQLQYADKLIAVPHMRFVATEVVELIAYEGPLGVSPLIFNARTEEERIDRLEASAIVATRTHALIDLKLREAIIEYNQRGAKANDIADALEATARSMKLGEQPAVELNPVADSGFLEAIERFGMIKLANLRVAKPNIDWTDNYDHMTAVAAESNARNIELTVAAHARDTLSRNGGVIQYIRSMVNTRLPALKAARVVGIRTGEEAQTTISLANHIEHQKVFTTLDENGHVVTSDILKKMQVYLNARRRRHVP